MNDELEIAAAEYVLGTLPAGERAQFSARLVSEVELREAVFRWQQRFATLDDLVTPEMPREEVWNAIRRVALQAVSEGEPRQISNVVSLRRSRAIWRAAAVTAGALAAALAGFIVLDRESLHPQISEGRYVAVVDTGGREPALIAEVDTAAGLIRIRSLAAEQPAGQSLELWHVPEGQAPRSLGLLEAGTKPQTITGRLAGESPSGIIAVSVEPAGGSPSGAPTGPVVYSGRLVEID